MKEKGQNLKLHHISIYIVVICKVRCRESALFFTIECQSPFSPQLSVILLILHWSDTRSWLWLLFLQRNVKNLSNWDFISSDKGKQIIRFARLFLIRFSLLTWKLLGNFLTNMYRQNFSQHYFSPFPVNNLGENSMTMNKNIVEGPFVVCWKWRFIP